MADDADRAPEAAVSTKGDKDRDSGTEKDREPGTFGESVKKRRGRPPGSKNRPVIGGVDPEGRSKAWLQKKLTSLLVAPSFAFEVVGEKWPAEHIGKAGPELAREITNRAERDPAFKLRLVAFLEGGETANLLFAAVMYVAPLGMYFGIVPAPPRVKAMLAIPERGALSPNGSVPEGFGPPSPEALLEEAQSKGYEDVGEYMADVQAAIQNVRKDVPESLA